MADEYCGTVRFTPSGGVRVDESEFDRFSEAAFDVEQAVDFVLECHIEADLQEQYVDVACVLLAENETEAERTLSWISGFIAHRVDVVAGRATTVGSAPRAERLTPA